MKGDKKRDRTDSNSSQLYVNKRSGIRSIHEEDIDVFHIESHPVGRSSQNRHAKALTLQAYEADIAAPDLLGPKQEQIIWKGLDHTGTPVEISTDRYDAVHLLDTLPEPSTTYETSELQFSEDLPSDAEDTFFLTSTEFRRYQKQKHLRYLEQVRDSRKQFLEEQNTSSDEEKASTYRPSQEESIPGSDQLAIMKKTASAVRAAKNPSILQMKILARHGNDPRFAFLNNGSFSKLWRNMLDNREPTGSQTTSSHVPGSLVDAAYQSDSSKEDDEQLPSQSTDAVQERRRNLAREWARSRQSRVAQDQK